MSGVVLGGFCAVRGSDGSAEPLPLACAAPLSSGTVVNSEGRICLNYVKGKCRNKGCRYVHDSEAREAAMAEFALAHKAQSRSTASALGSGAAAADASRLASPARTGVQEERQPPTDVPPPPAPPASSSSSWRSVDYLLSGESVRTQPYLKEFAEAPWLPWVLNAPECNSLFNVHGKSLRKELTEAFGLLHACRRVLSKVACGPKEHGPAGAVVVDLCCGKGFSSLILALSMPAAKVRAIDKNPRMELSHFRLAENLRFDELDLQADGEAERYLEKAASEAAALNVPLIVVGVHLCGTLSFRAVELFARLSLVPSAGAAFVLVPCCLSKRLPAIKTRARRLKVSPNDFWSMSLFFELRTAPGLFGPEAPAGEACRHELYVDDEVLSARNTFITTSRMLA